MQINYANMVILHIKKGDESHFLLESSVQEAVEDVLRRIVFIYNGRLKVQRLCNEILALSEFGASLPTQMQGLTDEQIMELNLKDEWADKYATDEATNRDPCCKRNGKPITCEMQQVLHKSVEEVRGMISKELVKSNILMTESHIVNALDILCGTLRIVYPMNLPVNDPVREELENREDLRGTQDYKMVLDAAVTQLWFAGKEIVCGNKLSHYVGNNEKSKVIVKVSKRGEGPPAREPPLSEEERKQLMVAEFNRREQLKKLEIDDDDSYLNASWADNHQLKKSFQGLDNISWKPPH